jgi:predicted dehydrogenase
VPFSCRARVRAEKPIATDLTETIEAINACNEAGVQLMTALQRRFDPNFRRVKQAVVNGEVGEVVTIKLCSRDPAPPPVEYVKGGGGIFKDMAVQCAPALTLAPTPASRSADGRRQRAPLTEVPLARGVLSAQ